jgi:hypothetical protein
VLVPGVIGHGAAKDHEAIVDDKEVVVFLPAIALVFLRPLARVALPLGTPEEVAFRHATLLEGVFDQALVIRAQFIEHLVKNSQATLGRGPRVLALGGSHKGILARLLSLLLLLGVAAAAAFIDVLLLLLLSLGVVEDCPYRLLAESKVGGNIQEHPSGAWALAPQLMDELFAGGSCEERPDDIGVSHVGQLGALPGESTECTHGEFHPTLVGSS